MLLPLLQTETFFFALSTPQSVASSSYCIILVLRLPDVRPLNLREELQPAAVLADLAHPADLAHRALVFGVVLGPVERALLVRRAAVNGREAGGADVKLGELVKLNLHGVVGIPLALRLGLLGL